MASFHAISAVGEGLARHLRRAYELSGTDGPSCDFQVQGAADFKGLKDDSAICALYLYRITHNEHTRNQPPVAPARLVPVDLHFMVSVWMDTALNEHTLLGWLIRELSRYPVLDPAMLTAVGGFAASDRLQLVPSELSLDDTAKLWQMLNAPYRPSLTYVARNVQIGPESTPSFAPVVATRLDLRDDVRAVAGAAL